MTSQQAMGYEKLTSLCLVLVCYTASCGELDPKRLNKDIYTCQIY